MRPRPSSLRLWRGLATAPYVPVAAYFGYTGFRGIFDQRYTGLVSPTLLQHVLPGWLIFGFAVALAVGGVLCVVGVMLGHTRTESAGLVFLLAAIVTFGVGGSWEYSEDPWPVILVSATFGAMFLIRMGVLSLARQAQTRAHGLRGL